MAWQWQSVAKPDDLLELLTPRLGTPLAVKDFKDFKVSVVDHGGVPEFHVFYQTGKPAQVSGKWAYRQAFDPIAVRDLLNSQGPNAGPVADARICGCWTGHQLEFHVFFLKNSAGLSAAPWNWQKAATPDGVVTFLNGAAPNALPVKNAQVVVVPLPHKTEFYIFYQNSVAEQPRDNWSWESFNDPYEVLGLLNITGPYPAPNRDLKIVTGSRQGSNLKFYAFKPQGFLIITRPMFVNSLTEYIRFKESLAFEVYVVTGEWIQDYVAGSDVRLQIRNCLRNYYYLAGVKYALLIGDSVDIQEPYNPTTYQAPPPPTLSEAWNLPAGYYHWTLENFPTYSTLFYADLSNKLIYSENDFVPGYPGYYAFLGDYKIYVGVIPARSTGDLECVLDKTINCKAANLLTFVYSFDCYSQFNYQEFLEIKSLAGAGVSMDLFVFQDAQDTTGKMDIYSALFEREGIIMEYGHGNLNQFVIGTTWITNADAARFKFITPLFGESSCYVQAYQSGDCLDEAFLRTPKGPAVMMSGTPTGGPPAPPGKLSLLTQGFWKDLLEGKTIGQAFYDHCFEAGTNPLHLFGDPSLVVVK
jgi:hypothetical protein